MLNYLIVGDGRLAQHLHHYFSILNLTHKTWSRRSNSEAELVELAMNADRILILITDGAITSFIDARPYLKEKMLIHCSGTLNTPLAESAHPLMTFTKDHYSREVYLSIPFITVCGRPALGELLPGLHNPNYPLPQEKKSLYHALCVMSGNFTTILWENAFETFEKELNLPRLALLPYMERTIKNLVMETSSNLTGPIQRGDVKTLIRNLEALNSRPEQDLYYAFLNFYLKKNKSIGELKYEHLPI